MWLYNNIEFTEEMVGTWFGYVYEITNLTNGRKYVGKKFFTRAGTKQIKGKKKKVRLSSGWANYWSSSEELKADVKQLLINQSADQVKIANLEQDVEELKSNYLSHELASFAKETAPNRVAKKEEGPEVPSGE